MHHNKTKSFQQDFQAVLLALLKQVPLQVEIESLMQQWSYFYERSIGCVGVLKDWLIRATSAALHDGSDTLCWERLQDHAMTLAQCERMALDAVEGEQKLGYMESRREHLWQLLQMGTGGTSSPPQVPNSVSPISPPVPENPDKKRTGRKRQTKEALQSVAPAATAETVTQSAPKKSVT